MEEKAANLLYFMIKDHPYVDGCKRIAASLFLEFLDKNNALFQSRRKRSNGETGDESTEFAIKKHGLQYLSLRFSPANTLCEMLVFYTD